MIGRLGAWVPEHSIGDSADSIGQVAKDVEGAQKALEEMTPEVAKTIDPGKARQALEFYKQAGASGRGGATAGVRVQLMKRILELQR